MDNANNNQGDKEMTQEEIKSYVEQKLEKAKLKSVKICSHCKRETLETLSSAQGSVCPDCYDICSD